MRARYEAGSADDHETIAAIACTHKQWGVVVDPHTAVGIAVAGKRPATAKLPVVLLATAHPAKFSQAVDQAIGKKQVFPTKLDRLMTAEERYTVLPNEVGAVRNFVLERIRTS